MMAESISDYNDGASSIKESRQFFEVPNLARRGPPNRTGASSVSSREVMRGEQRQIATSQEITAEPLRLLQWNAEGAHKKKDALKKKHPTESKNCRGLSTTDPSEQKLEVYHQRIPELQKRSREWPKRWRYPMPYRLMCCL